MGIAELWVASWVLPHLSPWKIVFICTTLLSLVFGLDDLIGPEHTNAWAKKWLSSGNRFFLLLTSSIRHSAEMLRIVVVVCVVASLEAAILGAFITFCVITHKFHIWIWVFTSFILYLLGWILGTYLQWYLESAAVTAFMRAYPEHLEIRILERVSEAIASGVESISRDRATQWRTPLQPVLIAVFIITIPMLILSFVVRTVWFLICVSIWFVVFAPPQALNALAKRTGAENYIKVGKYVLLLVLSVYAIIQM